MLSLLSLITTECTVQSLRNPSIVAHAINIDKPVTSNMWITQKHVPLWYLPAGFVGRPVEGKYPTYLT